MSSNDLFRPALVTILAEIFDGPPGEFAFLLNPGDPGLIRQLESISAEQASKREVPGKTTIAAHVDHVHYGLTLLNRWAAGEENPFATAHWDASWQRGQVTEESWKMLRDNLRSEATKWKKAVDSRTEWDEISAPGAIGSAAHTAYHLGAIRQILASQG